jgi:hypothetical protein
MIMKPQDVVIALKLCLVELPGSYAEMGEALGMSASEVHAGVRRLVEARLIDSESRRARGEVFLNFLVHGVPYAFPARAREVTRGMPTAWAAPAMAGKISGAEGLPPVWPDPFGKVQGLAVQPLYSSVPGAAARDAELYALLAWVDALRIGRARERNLAAKELAERLIAHVPA